MPRPARDSAGPASFGVVVPVKPPAVAKSRLGGLGPSARVELAAAFALDTVTAAVAALQVGAVLALTDDERLAAALREAGAVVVPDPASADLNASLVAGARLLAHDHPELRPAAVVADLPALRDLELGRALSAMPTRGAGFVGDRSGIGTTVYAADGLAAFAPRFGPGSRQAHLDAGAAEIDAVGLDTVRLDVDTPEDLERAMALGVGRWTAQVVSALGARPEA